MDAPDLGLPLRAVYPRRPIRASSPRADVAWRKGTIEIALQRLLYFAGWLAENQGVDWSASDLRALVDWKYVTAYRHAVFAGRATTESSFLRLVGQRARIASPYLEAIALKNGDEPLADSMAEVSARLASNTAVNGHHFLKTRLDRVRSENDIETMRRVANLVERAWTRDGAVADFAYDQFEKVAHTLVDRLQEDYEFSPRPDGEDQGGCDAGNVMGSRRPGCPLLARPSSSCRCASALRVAWTSRSASTLLTSSASNVLDSGKQDQARRRPRIPPKLHHGRWKGVPA